MFAKILYPTDFSDTAGKSLQYLKELRKAGAREVVLLNVIHQRILDSLVNDVQQNNFFGPGFA